MADLRESCFAAIETILAGLAGPGRTFALFDRMPDWDTNTLELRLGPALAMLDGSESAERQLEVPDTDMIHCAFSVDIWCQCSSSREGVVELNRLRAVVKGALGQQIDLGGLAVDVRYFGCDEPDVLDLTAGPSSGRLRLNWEVRRLELVTEG